MLSTERGLRVVVSATDGLDLGGSRWELTRPNPVLPDAGLAPYTDPDQPWPAAPDRGEEG